jgi:hypothetical protein
MKRKKWTGKAMPCTENDGKFICNLNPNATAGKTRVRTHAIRVQDVNILVISMDASPLTLSLGAFASVSLLL